MEKQRHEFKLSIVIFIEDSDNLFDILKKD